MARGPALASIIFALGAAPRFSCENPRLDKHMGLLKWLSRVGPVGGLVRSFADGYKRIRTANPDSSLLSDKEIFRHMVDARMSILPNIGQRAYIDPFLINPSTGLRHLVIGILMAENGHNDLFSFPSISESVQEVIDEEFAKSGLPKSVIEGSAPSSKELPLDVPTIQASPKQGPAFASQSLESGLSCNRCKTEIPRSQRGVHFTQCPKCETIIRRNA